MGHFFSGVLKRWQRIPALIVMSALMFSVVAGGNITPARGADVNVGGDPRLIGLWSNQEQVGSGQFSFTVQSLMEIDANGVLTQSGEDSFPVLWRAEAQILYISLGNGQPWVATANYEVNANSLLMSYADGTRTFWSRRR